MVGSNWLPQFRSDNHAGSFCGRTTSKQHDAATSILERRLEKTNGNTERNASAAKVTSIVGDRPGVFLKRLQGFGQLKFSLLDRHQEARRWACGEWSTGLGLHAGSYTRSSQAKHLLDLLCSVLLTTSEHIGLGAFLVTDFVDVGLVEREQNKHISSITNELYHCSISDKTNKSVLWEQAQTHHE